MNDYKLGQKITIKSYFKRVTKYIPQTNDTWKQRLKIWEEVPLKRETEAYVIGTRTLSNGSTQWDSDAGHMYCPNDYFEALYVVTHTRRKPIFTPIILTH